MTGLIKKNNFLICDKSLHLLLIQVPEPTGLQQHHGLLPGVGGPVLHTPQITRHWYADAACTLLEIIFFSLGTVRRAVNVSAIYYSPFH